MFLQLPKCGVSFDRIPRPRQTVGPISGLFNTADNSFHICMYCCKHTSLTYTQVHIQYCCKHIQVLIGRHTVTLKMVMKFDNEFRFLLKLLLCLICCGFSLICADHLFCGWITTSGLRDYYFKLIVNVKEQNRGDWKKMTCCAYPK